MATSGPSPVTTTVESRAAPAERRSLRSGIFVKVLAQGAIAVSTGLISVVVARALGPTDAGSYSIAFTFYTALVVIASLGLDLGIVYVVSRGDWSARRAFAGSQAMAIGLGVVGAALGYVLYIAARSAFAGLTSELILITVCGLPFGLSWLLGSHVALGLERYIAHVIPNGGQPVLALTLSVPLSIADGLRGALLAWTASNVLVAAAYAAWLGRRLRASTRTTTPSLKPARAALRFGTQTYVNNVLQFLYYRIDIFILAAVVGRSAAVGHYAVAVSIVTGLWLIPWAVSGVLLPRVASLNVATPGASAEIEARTLRHTVLVMVASCIVLVPLLIWLVPVIYGTAFRASSDLALLLVPGVACFGVGNVLTTATAGRGHPRFAMINGLLTAPVAIVLYVVLIDAHAATGAAIASSIAYAFSFAIAAVFYRMTTGVKLQDALVPRASDVRDYESAIRDGIRFVGRSRHRHPR